MGALEQTLAPGADEFPVGFIDLNGIVALLEQPDVLMLVDSHAGDPAGLFDVVGILRPGFVDVEFGDDGCLGKAGRGVGCRAHAEQSGEDKDEQWMMVTGLGHLWSLKVSATKASKLVVVSGQAVNWYRKAAEQGDARGQFYLGFMYAKGQGVPQDYKEAEKWFRKAAEQGNADAQLNLGFMYDNGQGVAEDETAAYMWYLLAGAKGNEIARKAIPKIEKRLTSEQRAEGQRMAKDWKLKKAQGK